MTNENETGNEEREQPTLSWDLVTTPFYAVMGVVAGVVSSYVYPTMVPDEIGIMRRGENENSLRELVFRSTAGYAYGASLLSHVQNIIENPRDITNYVPLLTNVVAGVGIAAYRIGKKVKGGNK